LPRRICLARASGSRISFAGRKTIVGVATLGQDSTEADHCTNARYGHPLFVS
jgi:hypothetical protein